MDKPDSQEICFIPSNNYGEFLEREFLDGKSHPGDIVDKNKKVIGKHDGYYHFTRGQRRGLDIAHHEKLYVTDIVATNHPFRAFSEEEQAIIAAAEGKIIKLLLDFSRRLSNHSP